MLLLSWFNGDMLNEHLSTICNKIGFISENENDESVINLHSNVFL